PYSLRQVRIEYFGFGEQLRYQFRLNTGEWSPPTEQRAVDYQDLGPGSYQFEVRALAADGNVSDSSASVVFTIIPPLWLRWWFLLIVVSVVAGSALLAHRWKLARVVEMERLRNRIATDLHDDIGSGLLHIAFLCEMVMASVGEQHGSRQDLVQRMAISARQVIESMGDLVWAMHSRRDNLEDLTFRMRRFASDTLQARKIELVFVAPAEADNRRLDPDTRREVYMIMK